MLVYSEIAGRGSQRNERHQRFNSKSGYDSTNSIVGVLDGKVALHVKTYSPKHQQPEHQYFDFPVL